MQHNILDVSIFIFGFYLYFISIVIFFFFFCLFCLFIVQQEQRDSRRWHNKDRRTYTPMNLPSVYHITTLSLNKIFVYSVSLVPIFIADFLNIALTIFQGNITCIGNMTSIQLFIVSRQRYRANAVRTHL